MHTWLPDAHTNAPTAGSVILAGVMLKMGTYGFLRFAIPLFPTVAIEATPLFMALAVIGIIYGALVAMVQPDLKRLVAYSSVSHLGFVMLGIFALNPRASTARSTRCSIMASRPAGLFLLVGMIYLRRHTREISEFGGLWHSVPIYAAVFMFVMLSSIGLPGLNGFVGEFLIMLGASCESGWPLFSPSSGVILGALYMLWTYERVMFGPITKAVNETIRDLNGREIAVMVPLMALMLLMGLYPASADQPHGAVGDCDAQREGESRRLSSTLERTAESSWPLRACRTLEPRTATRGGYHDDAFQPRRDQLRLAADPAADHRRGRRDRRAAGRRARRRRGERRARLAGARIARDRVRAHAGDVGQNGIAFAGAIAIDDFAAFFELAILIAAMSPC